MSRTKGVNPSRGAVGVRLDESILARLARLLPLYALPGREAKLSDVLRGVILAGLDVEERRLARIAAGTGSGSAPPG